MTSNLRNQEGFFRRLAGTSIALALILILPAVAKAQILNPSVTRVLVLDTRTVETDFSEAMGAAALDTANYTISGSGRGTFADHPDRVENQGNNRFYNLIWDAGSMQQGGDVTITVSTNVRDQNDNLPPVPPSNKATAAGGGQEGGSTSGIVRVDPVNGDDANDGSSWASAKRTVQGAIDELAEGEIWLKAGEYTATTNPLASINKGVISLYGGFMGTEGSRSERSADPALTVLNGQQARRVIQLDGSTRTTVIDGLTVTGSNNIGIYVNTSSANNVLINNCVIRNNSTPDVGGGVRGPATIQNCLFQQNTAGSGGGVASAKTVIGSKFVNNSAGRGGGISFTQQAINCEFVGNTATGSEGGGGVIEVGIISNCVFFDNSATVRGGAVSGKQMAISNCRIYGNRSAQGGGLYLTTQCSVANSDIHGNTATSGGGVWLNMSFPVGQLGTNPVVTNCRIIGNVASSQGGGAFVSDTLGLLQNCLIAGNEAGLTGGGVHFMSDKSILVNCTMDHNAAFGAGANFSTDGYVVTNRNPNYYYASRVTFVNCLVTSSWLHGGLLLAGSLGQANYPLLMDSNLFSDNVDVDLRLFQDDSSFKGADQINTLYFAANNRDGDPMYAFNDPATLRGTWESLSYDSTAKTTTLVDAGAFGATDSLTGQVIIPDIARTYEAVVLSNTGDSVVLVGDFVSSSRAAAGREWRIADHHLRAGSAAIDAGNSAYSRVPATDLDGNARVQGAGVDIGAYEFAP